MRKRSAWAIELMKWMLRTILSREQLECCSRAQTGSFQNSLRFQRLQLERTATFRSTSAKPLMVQIGPPQLRAGRICLLLDHWQR